MSNKPSFSVTEVVTATRCPRQFVLARNNHRVVPYGPDAFGQAAHAALSAIASGAKEDEDLHKLLDRALPDREAVEQSLFRLAFAPAYIHAKKVASFVDGGDLASFADIVRHIAKFLTPPMSKACARASNGRAAAASVFVASEEAVDLVLDDVTIRGRVDLLCRDGAEIVLWDLKTYAGTDLSQLEQVRLYAMAYAAKGIATKPGLVHVVRDRIQIDYADAPRPTDAQKVRTLAIHMQSWVDGGLPPVAPDLGTCRTCPAQAACWRSWGRTLPGVDDVASTSGIGATYNPPAPPPLVNSPVPPTANGDLPPMWIGQLGTKEPARINPIELVKHMAIFGAAGSGKTYLAKSIVEEAILAGIPVLAFDVQGDILTLAKPLEDDALDPSLRARRDRYRDAVDVRMLTPMSDAGLRLSLNPLKLPSRDAPVEQSTTYSEVVAENLLGHVKLPPSWRDHAKAYLAERIRGAMQKVTALRIEDLMAGILADEEVDDPLLERTQRARLAKELRLLTVGTNNYLFRSGRPFDLDALLEPTQANKTPLNVLWLNGLGDQQNKASFIAMVLADVYGWMLKQRSGAPRVLLYFDEIGPYMPPHGEPPTKKLLKQVFKEGRKFGVCGLFCTQNFTDVDYKVVSQANTIAVGRLNAAQEKKKAADALGAPTNFDVNAAVDKLVGSNPGRFVIKRVDGSAQWLQGRSLLTRHGGTWGEDEIRAHTSEEARRAWEGKA